MIPEDDNAILDFHRVYSNDVIKIIDLNDPMNGNNKQGVIRLGVHEVHEYANILLINEELQR